MEQRLQKIIAASGLMSRRAAEELIEAGKVCVNGAVASLGTALTEGHARLLKRHTDNVILTYDSDAAGTKAAMRAIPILREAGFNIRVLDLKPYKDPDELIVHEGAAGYEERIRNAVNFFLFQSDIWKRNYDLSDPAGLTAYFRQLAEELTTFQDELERENYLNAVCERQKIDPALLRKMTNRIGNRRMKAEPDPAAEVEEAPAPAKAKAKGKAKEKKEPEREVDKPSAVTPAKTYTKADLRKALYNARNEGVDIVSIYQQYGVNGINDLPEAAYAEIIELYGDI